jgi:hypothetical protein
MLLDMQSIWIKNAFWNVNNRKWYKWCKFVSLFLYNNGLPLLTMDTNCPNQVFLVFDCSIYRRFVLNRGWKLDTLEIIIFVQVCSAWNIVELKTRFETWITRNDVSGVSLNNLNNIITHIAYLWSQLIPNVQIKYFIYDWSNNILFVLNRRWKLYTLQIMIFVNICSTFSVVELKTRFEPWITRNDVNGVSLFPIYYLITLTAYLYSKRTPKVQIKYFMFDWLIYRIFVLNRCWKIVSLQIMIFVNVCSTCSLVELKTCFQNWITRNDINVVSLFNLSLIKTRMTYLCSQWTPNVQINYF